MWKQTLSETLASDGLAVESVEPLHGGACQENFAVQTDGGRFVLRSDANQSLPGSLGRALEAAVVRTAVENGVPTPAIRTELPDLLRPGADAYLMEWADGLAIGVKVQKDPRLAGAREALLDQLAGALAKIHAIRPEHAPDLRPDNPQDARTSDAVTAALRFCREMMDAMPPRPAMERVFRWLHTHRPDPGPLVLAHGDYRLGNFLVTPEGLSAVLDWEFSHWGSAAEDLAWITVRDWRFSRPDLAVAGLFTREAFVERYLAAGGVALSAETLTWFEVLGNLRWATGAVFQAQRVLSGAEADLELLAIGRRAVEMEWEALRVIGALSDVPDALGPDEAVSTDTPDASTLLGGVAGFLAKQVVRAVDDRGLSFRIRIAAHLAGVAAREAAVGGAHARADRRALASIGIEAKGHDRDAVTSGIAALAEGIASGRQEGPAVDAVLTGMLARQLRISNPRFDLGPTLGEDPWTS